jgi:hypothetical protein
MLEVEKVRPITTRWHVMSLAVLNEGTEDPQYKERLKRLWRPVRVCIAAQQRLGDDVLLPLYTSFGNLIHRQKRNDDDLVKNALASAGLPSDLADAANSDAYDDAVRKSHHEGMQLVGDGVGTPVIRVKEVAFFGPVVTPAPKGEAAGRLWDGFTLVAGIPGFYELKRSRTERPTFD